MRQMVIYFRSFCCFLRFKIYITGLDIIRQLIPIMLERTVLLFQSWSQDSCFRTLISFILTTKWPDHLYFILIRKVYVATLQYVVVPYSVILFNTTNQLKTMHMKLIQLIYMMLIKCPRLTTIYWC